MKKTDKKKRKFAFFSLFLLPVCEERRRGIVVCATAGPVGALAMQARLNDTAQRMRRTRGKKKKSKKHFFLSSSSAKICIFFLTSPPAAYG
jgi:hypothetical protein